MPARREQDVHLGQPGGGRERSALQRRFVLGHEPRQLALAQRVCLIEQQVDRALSAWTALVIFDASRPCSTCHQ